MEVDEEEEISVIGCAFARQRKWHKLLGLKQSTESVKLTVQEQALSTRRAIEPRFYHST